MTSIIITCVGHCGRTVRADVAGGGLLAANDAAESSAKEAGWHIEDEEAYCPECQAKREPKPQTGHEFEIAFRWLSLPYRHQFDIMRRLGMNPRGDAVTDGVVLFRHAASHGKLATIWHLINNRCTIPRADCCPFVDLDTKGDTDDSAS